MNFISEPTCFQGQYFFLNYDFEQQVDNELEYLITNTKKLFSYFFLTEDMIGQETGRLEAELLFSKHFDTPSIKFDFSECPDYRIAPVLFTELRNLIWKMQQLADKPDDTFFKKELIRLYKTYHRESYMFLKRYNRIDRTVIQEMQFVFKEGFLQQICLILIMSEYMGHKLSIDDCKIFYFTLSDFYKKTFKDAMTNEEQIHRETFLDLIRENQTVFDEAVLWMTEQNEKSGTPFIRSKNYKIFRMMQNFIKKKSSENGHYRSYFFGYFEKNFNTDIIRKSMIEVKFYLTLKYPDKNFDFDMIQMFAMINLLLRLNLEQNEMFDSYLHMFKKTFDENAGRLEDRKTETISIENDNTVISSSDFEFELEKCKSELTLLREKYKQLKNELNEQKLENKTTAKEYETLKVRYEVEHTELVQIREELHKYQQQNCLSNDTVTENCINESSISDMVSILKKYQLVIIGGHENRIKKLKNYFPKWKYISSESNQSENIISSADQVFIFSDHLSHSTFGRFIEKCRKDNIPVYYLPKTVNIQYTLETICQYLSV